MIKFRALLFLKDLVNNKHKRLIDYTEKKILKRLYEIARSEFKENVLLQSEPSCDPKISADFYQLVLECLNDWGTKFGETNHTFKDKRYRLVTDSRLPVKPVFINFPGPDEEFVYTDTIRIDGKDIERLLIDTRVAREKLTAKLLQNKASSFKTWEVEEQLAAYWDAYNKLDRHPDKKTLVNDVASDPKLDAIKDDLLNELLYYQSFYDAYSKAEDLESNKNFYIELKKLNKNFFNKNIDIESCIITDVKPAYVYEPDDINDNPKKSNKIIYGKDNNDIKERSIENQYPPNSPTYNNKQRRQSEDDADYNYNGFKLDDDDNYSYDMIEDPERSRSVSKNKNPKPKVVYQTNQNFEKLDQINSIAKENQELANAVAQLEQQKRELASRIKDAEGPRTPRRSNIRSNSFVSTSVREKTYANEGLMNIIRNKEEQIQAIQDKIKKLEREQGMLDMSDEDLIDIRPTANNNNKSKYKSRSNLNISAYKTEPRTPTRLANAHLKSENSGTEFVNQMYTNINKLLNKTNNRQAVKDQSYVY